MLRGVTGRLSNFASIGCRLAATANQNQLLVSRDASIAQCSRYSTSLDSAQREELDKLVKSSKVFVFMKGVPEQPMCGFSNAVVQILRMHGVPFSSVDVLENTTIREGVKQYSEWPTIPQIFIDGEFVGGCDVMIEMHKNGDLVDLLEKAGLKSAVPKPSEQGGKKD